MSDEEDEEMQDAQLPVFEPSSKVQKKQTQNHNIPQQNPNLPKPLPKPPVIKIVIPRAEQILDQNPDQNQIPNQIPIQIPDQIQIPDPIPDPIPIPIPDQSPEIILPDEDDPTSTNSNSDSSYNPSSDSSSEEERVRPPNLRPANAIQPPDYFGNPVVYSVQSEPTTFDEMLKSDESEKWKDAVREEFSSHAKMKTWEIVKRPRDKPAVKNKWCLSIKPTPMVHTAIMRD